METLTREELFELIWTTPVSKLAARFGISGVALAKTCAKFSIPRPGRGYWQQLAVGIKAKRPRLPPSKLSGPVVVARTHLVRGRAPAQPKHEWPVVKVPDHLKDPHEAVRWVEASLATAKADAYGRLVVGLEYSPSFCVGPGHVRRMLRILDALAKALVERGHEITAAQRFEHSTQRSFLLRTQGAVVALEFEEKLARKPHVLTAEEKERKARWGYETFQKYDYSPEGELRLKLTGTHYKYAGQKSWSDTRTQRLEDLLGRAVLAIEEAAEIGRVEHEEQVRLANLRETEERKRLRVERLRWYDEWLTDDLDTMLDDWARARRIREFMKEYDRRLPADARSELAARWSRAALALAEQIDPMNHVADIAKELEPSNEVLAQLVEQATAEAKRTAAGARRF